MIIYCREPGASIYIRPFYINNERTALNEMLQLNNHEPAALITQQANKIFYALILNEK